MFKSEKVPAFIQAVAIVGDAGKQRVRILVYVTPCTPELALEVSPIVNRTLFQDSAFDDKQVPVMGLGPVPFSLGEIPLQNIQWYAVPDGSVPNDGMLTEKALISKVRSAHVVRDKPEILSLIFEVEVPVSAFVLELAAVRFFKRKVFITTTPTQQLLFQAETTEQAVANAVCERCNESASWMDSTGAFFCNNDVRMGVGEMKRIKPLETPKQAEQRVLTETEKALETPIPGPQAKPDKTTKQEPAPAGRSQRRTHISRVH